MTSTVEDYTPLFGLNLINIRLFIHMIDVIICDSTTDSIDIDMTGPYKH